MPTCCSPAGSLLGERAGDDRRSDPQRSFSISRSRRTAPRNGLRWRAARLYRRPLQWGATDRPASSCRWPSCPRTSETDRILAAGGELVWRAGPLNKGAGLCHGTAGNAYAFLSLFARFADERWLERARIFAMDAVADVNRRRDATGRGRYTLFTGDIGVALLLRSCLAADATFPFIGQAA